MRNTHRRFEKRSAMLVERAGLAGGVAYLADGAAEFYEALVDVAGSRGVIHHRGCAIPENVERCFGFGVCVQREDTAQKAVYVSIKL